MLTTIHFLLVPDASAARRLKRLIAESSARLGVLVGTFNELLHLAQRIYAVQPSVDCWNDHLEEAVASFTDAFWSSSFQVDPQAVVKHLESTLALLLHATPHSPPIVVVDTGSSLSERSRRYLADIKRLHEAVQCRLPPDLALIEQLLAAPRHEGVYALSIYRHESLPTLTCRQQALIGKITDDYGIGVDPELTSCLSKLFQPPNPASSPLTLLQTALFSSLKSKVIRDESLQWVAVRDYQEELELAAGMIQQIMDKNKLLSCSDFAVLLPDATEYAEAASTVFAKAGIPLSGLSKHTPLRDIGAETVRNFITALKVPAPCMAQAALLASPLMPWQQDEGTRLAQSLMDGNRLPEGNLLAPLIQDRPTTTGDLVRRLKKFLALISVGHAPERHTARARDVVGEMLAFVSGAETIDWKALEMMATPKLLKDAVVIAFSQQGVSVFQENEEPWRICRILFVLGFTAGHYPVRPGVSPLFSQDDIRRLNNCLGYRLDLDDEYALQKRELFKRQLCSASDEITFFLPRRDAGGGVLHPSESLTFMAQLFSGVGKPEELLLESDREEHRPLIRNLAVAAPAQPVPPRRLETDDPLLGCNLLTRRKDREGKQKAESPSGLEVLLVSPLMWLLQRYGMEPREWVPDTLDVMTKGTLAHNVFECLFAPGRPLPEKAEISERLTTALITAIKKTFPLLECDEWRVEFRHLKRDIEKAALAWGKMLKELSAAATAVEVTLVGKLDALPLSGKADLLLSLPNGRMLVVDYKKSGSKGRIERMKKGFDMQTSLYRIMLETGGVANDEALAGSLKKVGEIGALYYLLNDQTAVSDSSGWTAGNIAGFHEMGDGISENALTMIRERIGQLEAGQVVLNSNTDEEWFEKKAGIKPYAFDNSPLVRLFMKQVENGMKELR